MLRIYSLFSIILILFACTAKNINTSHIPKQKNFYKVDDSLYRSAQPSSKEMKDLSNDGIKTVLNLRLFWNDKQEGKHTNLVLVHQPLNTNKISYEDIVCAMKTIQQAKKPVLIHCLHGSDRTGCMVAVYRMLCNGWTKEEAIKEFKEGGFGYHEKWFPNIVILLNSLDEEKLKKDLGISSQ